MELKKAKYKEDGSNRQGGGCRRLVVAGALASFRLWASLKHIGYDGEYIGDGMFGECSQQILGFDHLMVDKLKDMEVALCTRMEHVYVRFLHFF